MEELKKIFNDSIKAGANRNYDTSDRLELLFFKVAEKLGYSYNESSFLWDKFLIG